MNYNKDIITTMKQRHASRTYTAMKMDEKVKESLLEAMVTLATDEFRFELIDYKPEKGTKLGTYGMIKGASAFLVGLMKKSLHHDQEAALRFGFAFEELILKATELGLGTCWMVATFNTNDIKKFLTVDEDENIVMVSPTGYEEKRRGAERLTRYLAKSDQRKPWSELFYHKSMDVPLTREEAGDYAAVLDMVRIGPSASNKQPWRIIKTATTFDLYLGDSGYPEMKGQKISKGYNDMGIAKAHFDLAAKSYDLAGAWGVNNSIKDKTYVCSWQWA